MKRWRQMLAVSGICLLTLGNMVAYGEGNSAIGPGQAQVMTGTEQYQGWVKNSNRWYYYQNGELLTSSMTPDGFYVDESGMWEQKTITVLNEKIKAPTQFLPNRDMGNWDRIYDMLNRMNQYIYNQTSKAREFRLYEDSVVYNRIDGNNQTELLSLRKSSNGGYQIRISTNLGTGTVRKNLLSTYDYQVLRFFCAVISSTPERLADALYGSWQSSNPSGLSMWAETPVGDAMVKCDAESGTGIYNITQRTAGQ